MDNVVSNEMDGLSRCRLRNVILPVNILSDDLSWDARGHDIGRDCSGDNGFGADDAIATDLCAWQDVGSKGDPHSIGDGNVSCRVNSASGGQVAYGVHVACHQDDLRSAKKSVSNGNGGSLVTREKNVPDYAGECAKPHGARFPADYFERMQGAVATNGDQSIRFDCNGESKRAATFFNLHNAARSQKSDSAIQAWAIAALKSVAGSSIEYAQAHATSAFNPELYNTASGVPISNGVYLMTAQMRSLSERVLENAMLDLLARGATVRRP